MDRILYVDDKNTELDYYKSFLSDDYIIDVENESLLAADRIKMNDYAAIILDVNMPILSGFQVYEKIIDSKDYNNCPIIFKTSHQSEENIIKGLNSGLEYLTPEMTQTQIKLRIKNQISKHSIKMFGTLRLDIENIKVTSKESEIDTTLIQFKILKVLIHNKDRPISREAIVDLVYGEGTAKEQNTINTHIMTLKKKIEVHGVTIKSQRSVGYRLEHI